MPHRMTRREFAATAAAGLAALGFRSRADGAGTKTLRFIAGSDLRVLDPIWTTAGITRAHGYMVFDTPFALDAKFRPQPQMVGDYNISPDQLLYAFTLRDGLKFHDGEPVRGTDCVASLQRWMVRDAFGQSLAAAVDKMEAVGDKGLTIRLKEPFPLALDALAKIASPPFIMPERLAKTDPYQQVTEAVGSGPFKFVKEEFQPGHMAVYVKNTDYVPRSEPPSWASGGKVVRVDRVEWLFVPDAMTKAAALASGEADWWDSPPPDIWPVLAANPEITLAELDPLGSMGTLRFNHLHPPFDNVKMRQAVLAAADQVDFLVAYAGDPENWKLCRSFFTCGTPMANDAGSAALTGKRDLDKAKNLIAADLFRKLGLTVEIAASDWGNLTIRRASKKPVDQGGWNVFGTSWFGADMLHPGLNQSLRTNGDAAWFGWPKDDKLEALRSQWMKATASETRQEIAAAIQERAFEVVPYIPTGQWKVRTAYRKNLKHLVLGPVIFQWGVDKV